MFFLFSVPHDLFWPDLLKSLAKISQRPESRKDWSKLLMVLSLATFLKELEIQIRNFFLILRSGFPHWPHQPHWEDKREGISKIFLSFFTLFLYISWRKLKKVKKQAGPRTNELQFYKVHSTLHWYTLQYMSLRKCNQFFRKEKKNVTKKHPEILLMLSNFFQTE